jgi:hypothetical protein
MTPSSRPSSECTDHPPPHASTPCFYLTAWCALAHVSSPFEGPKPGVCGACLTVHSVGLGPLEWNVATHPIHAPTPHTHAHVPFQSRWGKGTQVSSSFVPAFAGGMMHTAWVAFPSWV